MLRTKVVGNKKVKLPPEGLLCNHPHRPCMQNRLDGYEYCIRHILEDKTAPYKQCNYVYPKNGKRCPSAMPKLDRRDGFCQEHTKKALLMRQKLTRKRKPVVTAERLLEDMEQFANKETRTDLFNNFDASHMDMLGQGRSARFYNSSKMAGDCVSDTESEREPPLVDESWHGDADSDAESVDSEHEDPLKHAGVYTAEEVALITRDKLTRLQSLYIEQFKRLQHVLREKRRKYLHTVKTEKESLGSISATPRTSDEEVEQYERLKSLNRYHRRQGLELVLHSQAKEKRLAATEGAAYRPPVHQRCIHTVNNGGRCNDPAMPLSKYCQTHILYDPHQVLFRPCSSSCAKPVIPAVHGPSCILHTALPVFPSLVKEEDCPAANQDSLDLNKSELNVDVVTPDMEDNHSALLSQLQGVSDVELPIVTSVPPHDIFAERQPSPETDVEK